MKKVLGIILVLLLMCIICCRNVYGYEDAYISINIPAEFKSNPRTIEEFVEFKEKELEYEVLIDKSYTKDKGTYQMTTIAFNILSNEGQKVNILELKQEDIKKFVEMVVEQLPLEVSYDIDITNMTTNKDFIAGYPCLYSKITTKVEDFTIYIWISIKYPQIIMCIPLDLQH